jgi:hypothetical protein
MLLTTLMITDSYGRGMPLGVRGNQHTQERRL